MPFNEESGTRYELSWPSRDLLFSFYILGRGFMSTKKLKTKVIAVGLTGVVVSGVVLNQQYEIRQLEKDLQIQQNITDQKHNYTETLIDISTLKEQLNEECNFKVLDSTITIRHTYSYKRDSILGFKSEYKLVGTADFYYALTTNLSQATIMKVTENKIVIEVPRATIDEKAYHRVANSFVRLDLECSANILSNKQDAEKATRQWEDSFDTKGIEYVEKYMARDSVRNKIDQLTVRQVQALFEKLGYSQAIEVIIK